MANRLVGNTIIIDSGMGNNFILTSANQIVNLVNIKVNAFGFRSVNTTSTISSLSEPILLMLSTFKSIYRAEAEVLFQHIRTNCLLLLRLPILKYSQT